MTKQNFSEKKAGFPAFFMPIKNLLTIA